MAPPRGIVLRPCFALLLLAASLTAGCLGQHTYSLVWVHGEERLEPAPVPHESCSYLLDHEVRPDKQVLRYRQTPYPLEGTDIDRVIAFDIFSSPGDCPIAYRLEPNAREVTTSIGHYGSLDISFEPNGTVNVEDRRFLQPGETTTFTYSRPTEGEDPQQWYNGTIQVEFFEGWPISGLRAEDV